MNRTHTLWKFFLFAVFLSLSVVSILLYGYTTWTLTKSIEKKLDGNCTRILRVYRTNPRSNFRQNSCYTATYLPSLNPFKSDQQNIRYTAEVRVSSKMTFSCGLLHADEQVLDVRLELIYNSCVETQDVVLRTCWMRWTIRRMSRESQGNLSLQHDIMMMIYVYIYYFHFHTNAITLEMRKKSMMQIVNK